MSACSADPPCPFLSLLPSVHDPPYMPSIYLTVAFRPRAILGRVPQCHRPRRMRGNNLFARSSISLPSVILSYLGSQTPSQQLVARRERLKLRELSRARLSFEVRSANRPTRKHSRGAALSWADSRHSNRNIQPAIFTTTQTRKRVLVPGHHRTNQKKGAPSERAVSAACYNIKGVVVVVPPICDPLLGNHSFDLTRVGYLSDASWMQRLINIKAANSPA